MYKEVGQCRLCGNPGLQPILNLGEQYLTGIFPPTPDTKLTRGPLQLVKCVPSQGDQSCGLVQLRHSYDSQEMYGTRYGYRSGLNQAMVRHLSKKAASLYQLARPCAGDLLLDIGSNDGTLLGRYPGGEELALVGMDPTIAKFRKFYPPHVTAIADFFNAAIFRREVGDRKAKIITSIAMLYDLEEPLSFALQVRDILAPDGIWHFEQSYLPEMLRVNAYDTICHEHVEYYCLAQILWMTRKAGLKVLDVEVNDVNGGSFAVTVAHEASNYPVNTATIEAILRHERNLALDTIEPYIEFERRVFTHRDQLLALLDQLRGEGRSVAGYGASTKGNVILQFCSIGPDRIPYIAEVNPDKFGSFTPGSGIPIISEAEAHARNPDVFLVLPWHFRENLLQREAEYLRAGGRLLFPLPELELVSS